jgi:precorrin-6B C5,15-methyltransferase / cobalt-precorrin-6B C5,C15-methyltransferase
MTKWLTIIGMGEDGWEGLSNRARLAIKSTDVIVGSERLLKLLPKSKAEILEWPQPFSAVG